MTSSLCSYLPYCQIENSTIVDPTYKMQYGTNKIAHDHRVKNIATRAAMVCPITINYYILAMLLACAGYNNNNTETTMIQPYLQYKNRKVCCVFDNNNECQSLDQEGLIQKLSVNIYTIIVIHAYKIFLRAQKK